MTPTKQPPGLSARFTPRVRDLPREWRVPLYALTEAAVSEVVGGFVDITVGIPSKGPLVVVGPVLDRIHDLQAIYEASKGIAEAQTVTLYAIALGAEITAELAAKYPGDRTDAVIAQWKSETFSRLPQIVGQDDAQEVRWIVELGLVAFGASHRGDEYETAQLIRDLNLVGKLSDGPLALSAEGPLDLVMKLMSGGDAPRIAAEAFVRGTRLRETAARASPHGLEDPLTVDCARARSVDRNLPACPFAETNTAVGSGSYPAGAGKTRRPMLLLDRPRGTKIRGVVAADQYVVTSEATTYTVPCRGNLPRRNVRGSIQSAEAGVYRLSYFGEGEYRFLRSNGEISTPWLGESDLFAKSFPDECSDLYETWSKVRLENGQIGWALIAGGVYRYREELQRWDIFYAVDGLSRHDDFNLNDLPAWTRP